MEIVIVLAPFGKHGPNLRYTEDQTLSPFRLKLVGLALGGHPITDYAPDFWLITTPELERVGYVTSPWWSPELSHNIALGFVPVSLSEPGCKLKVELPEAYSEVSGQPVDAVVVDVPFRPSEHPSAREQVPDFGSDEGH